MKQYDFENIIFRNNSGSHKWDEMLTVPGVEKYVIPFSVADMELKNAPEIIEGLKAYLDKSVLGYVKPNDAFRQVVADFIERRHGWKIEKEWLKDSHGVVTAFFAAVTAFTEPGDGVILMTPIYFPMYMAATLNNRKEVHNSLLLKGDHYEIDFEDLEAKARDPKNKILILCSPHNPTGRVWTVDELTRIGRICIDNNVLVVADEIHNDLIMPGYHHTMFGSISEEFAQHSITLTSPSKTFNLAGMQVANLIVPNDDIREKYWHEFVMAEGSPKCNILGYEACRIAYTQCDEWLDQVIQVIDINRKTVSDFLAKEFPQIRVIPTEGTYLLWMDFRSLGIECHELARILREEAHLFFDDGFIFGKEGEGFERWNLACPTKFITAALERMKKALNAHL